MITEKQRYENIDLAAFAKLCKPYDIPAIAPVHIKDCPELIGFNYAKSEKNPQEKGIHFFLDDYQFARLWNSPARYISLLRKFRLVFTPDFSLYNDYPRAIQIYNHYRKHLLGAYWQSEGMTVIPTICWSDDESFDWCFDGEPVGGAVAVSSLGTQAGNESKGKFLAGYSEMMKRLAPETIIFYGSVPKECKGNIIEVKPFYEKFKEVKINGRQRCFERCKC